MAARGPSNRLGRHLGLAAALIALDQLTKWIAVRALDFGERVPVIPGFFDFTLVYNRGAAFSFLAGAGGWQRWFFTGIGIAAAVFIVWMLARHGSQRLFAFALSLILAGAIGNVIDRVWQGKVTDFVLLYWRGWHWPAFNVADMAITFGAALLILDEIRRVRRSR
ncbi:signal peptidase II [Zeimonas arvi]|uniref:Lipoprotein signal peptidase n=1 Tax=Zeimonas arvi TaxID=2498847 RepID=A0A5C8NYZ4_9BURK|nr:signal peptidase II [Zeimonas arvi]TXL66225.1 lipoprotein signal peptidase [Zeimonas arvi]